MKNISNKLILFLSAIVITYFEVSIQSLVVITLISLVATCLLEYIENPKISLVVFILFVFVSLFYRNFLFFLPLIMYDIIITKYQYFSFLGIVPVALNSRYLDIKKILVLAIICLCEFIIKYQQTKDEHKLNVYLNQRDEQTEKRIILEERIKALADRQDAEINIAMLNERNRIAHEIHDNVGHLLSSSIIQIGAIMAVTKEETTKKNLENIKETLDKGMNSIRQSIHNLHDNSVNLEDELKHIINNFFFCKIKFLYEVNTPPSIKIRYDIIAIVKEALSNVIKHSDATRVTVSFLEHPNFYQLIVSDNGTKKPQHNSSGMGLDGIKQRVNSFNGIVNISFDNGFRIFVSIPKKGWWE